ncbi:MAG: class I SAM-dependent DNA methyltransferase [Flavobacteriales bacterium]
MNRFGNYSHYYDLLYKNKDYRSEAEYVLNLLKKHSPVPVKSLLDIGCGTGAHDVFLNRLGLDITGIDLSQDMVDIAKENYGAAKGLSFEVGDCRTFNLNKKFDAVVSLFHVMCYNTKNEDLLNTFKNAYHHLGDKGIFVFDFWYGPGVLQDLPSDREKVMEDEKIHVLRKTRPVLHFHENVVDVNFNVTVSSKLGDPTYALDELHKVRYFFYPEIQYLLTQVGFKSTQLLKWMSTDEEPGGKDWYALIVAEK